ncbi:MAG: response regulator [Thiobacillus sp.]|nr:response regulator [Thiobacillus sp.]
MNSTVFVVDDDDAMRDALAQLLEAAGLQVEIHANGSDFLAAFGENRPGCVLLDMAMPGMTGLEVQAALKARGWAIPILFLTGHGDIPMAVQAVQAGAADFLEKPVDGATLLERVQRALKLDQEWRQIRETAQAIQLRHARLSPRECEVMTLAVTGLTSKEIAQQLGLSPRTVEVHRTHVMHKMGATNLAELIKLAASCLP